MRKFLRMSSVALLFCFALHLSGQTVITHSNHAPFIGYGAVFMNLWGDFEPLNIDPGPAGPNQTWNFSAFVGTETDNLLYIDPAATPFADQIAGTGINLAIIADDEDEGGFGFMTVSTSQLTLEAFGVMDEGDPLYFQFFNPPLVLSYYPFAYGNNADTYGEMEVTIEGFTQVSKSWITYSADAWGTIITPHGTFQNTLRVKTTSIDSTLMYMGGILIMEFGMKTVDYSWVSANHRSPVFEISGDMDFQYEVWSISYLVSETVGIEEKVADAFNVYPNPARNTVFIEHPQIHGKVTCRIIDLTGRMVHESIIDGSLGKSTIDVSAMQNGIYTLQIIRNNEFITAKKIIILGD